MHGQRARQREGPGVQAGVLLQRGAAGCSGAAAEERRWSLQDAPQGGQHQGFPLRPGGQSHPRNLPGVRAGQRLGVRRAGEAQRGHQRGLRGPLHLLAADVRHRGSFSGHRLAGQQRRVQGGYPGVRVHPPAQGAWAAHQGGCEETHSGLTQGKRYLK